MNFEQIEDGIIGALRAGVPAIKTVGTYAGEFEAEAAKLPLRLPAAFVMYGGSGHEPVAGAVYREEARFTVLIAARDLRDGEGRESAYALVRGALSALTNVTFGAEMERLRPVRTELVHTGRGMTVYGVEFGAAFDAAY